MTINLNNRDDVFDLIVDAAIHGNKITQQTLDAILNKLYEDRRGGTLADLWASKEFMNALQKVEN